MIDYDDTNPEVIKFTELLPEEIIKEECLDDYTKEVDAIWRQLVRLNSNIVVMGQLIDFVHDLFVLGDEIHSWDLILLNLLDSSIMIAWKLRLDHNKDTLTINKMKNTIFKDYIKKEYKSEFSNLFKTNIKGKKMEQIDKIICEIRNNVIGHFNYMFNVNKTEKRLIKIRPDLNQLKEIKENLNQVFDKLCFGCQKEKLHISLIFNGKSSKKPSQIEKIFKSYFKDHDLINMPEEQKGFWSECRKKLSNEQLSIINKYRREFGLQEV